MKDISGEPEKLQGLDIAVITRIVEILLPDATGNATVCTPLCIVFKYFIPVTLFCLQMTRELFELIDDVLQSPVEEILLAKEEFNTSRRYEHSLMF